MVSKKTTFVCPHCFEKHKLSEVQFRCANRTCREYDDLEMTKYVNGDLKMPKQEKKTFTVSMKNTFTVAYSAKCPDCGETTYKHICPSCHNELPDSTLTSKDIIVPIVGTLTAGKSHFIGVLVKGLRDRISVSFNGVLEGFGDSYQRWERIYGDKLYLDKLLLPRRDVLMPLILKFKIMKKSLFGNRIDTVTMAFFDFDENRFCYENTRHIFNKFVSNSSGIIFLIDPMQIPKVVNKLDDSVIKRNTRSIQK